MIAIDRSCGLLMVLGLFMTLAGGCSPAPSQDGGTAEAANLEPADMVADDKATTTQRLKVGPKTTTFLAQIEQMFLRGDFAAGLELAQRIDSQAPDTPRIQYLIGSMLGAQGKHREAIEHFEAELVLDPKHIGSLLGLATAHHNLSDLKAELPLLEKAFALEPKNPTILRRLGQSLAASGQLAAAEEQLRAALEIGPDAEAFYELGELQRQGRDHAAAERSFRKALFEDPWRAAAMHGLGQSLLRLGREEEAREVLARFEQLAAFDKKFGELLEVSRRSPPPAGVFQGLARFHRTRGDLAAAAAAYQHSLTLEPNQATSAYGLVSIFLEQGRLSETTRWALHALSKDPQNWRCHYWLGRTRLAKGQVIEAQEAFATSQELSVWPADTHLELATVAQGLGHTDLAAKSLEQAKRLAPTSPQVPFEQAYQALLAGDWEDASNRLAEALALDSKHPGSLMLSGFLALENGQPLQAREAFQAVRVAQRVGFLGRGSEDEWLSKFTRLPNFEDASALFPAVRQEEKGR